MGSVVACFSKRFDGNVINATNGGGRNFGSVDCFCEGVQGTLQQRARLSEMTRAIDYCDFLACDKERYYYYLLPANTGRRGVCVRRNSIFNSVELSALLGERLR